MREDVELAALLDHDAGAREVRGPRQVDAGYTIAVPEVFEPQRLPGGLPDVLGREPRLRAVLLDVAVLREELGLLREAPLGDCNFVEDIIDGDGDAQVREALVELVDVVPSIV